MDSSDAPLVLPSSDAAAATLMFLQKLDAWSEKVHPDLRKEIDQLQAAFKSQEITGATFKEAVKDVINRSKLVSQQLFLDIQKHLDAPVVPAQTFAFMSKRLMFDEESPEENRLIEARAVVYCAFCSTSTVIPMGPSLAASKSMLTLLAGYKRYDVCNTCIPKLFEHFATTPKEGEEEQEKEKGESNKRRRT